MALVERYLEVVSIIISEEPKVLDVLTQMRENV